MSFLSQFFRSRPAVSREPLPAEPPAVPWPAQGLWAYAAYAPLQDLFWQTREETLDLRKVIYDARLPEPLGGLLYLGVRRSRRSRRQRVALARERIAAFSASLAAGHTPRQVADDFRQREARGDYRPASQQPLRIGGDLPEPIVQWIERVAAQARLAPAASHEAAAELADNFAARLAAGESLDSLREQLGDVAQASQLLRQTRLALAVTLPSLLRALLDEVLRRARLWPSERRDVARELTDHFSDGLAAGRSAEQLAADFGNPRQAARLIRRAKLRNRPLAWRMLRYSAQGLAFLISTLLIMYGVLCVRYLTARPTILHNYMADINRQEQAIPPDDRAWPLYREALLNLPREGRPDARGFERNAEAEEFWPEVVAYLDEHQETLSLIRRAANKPRFGFVFGDPANREFLQEFGGGPGQHGESPERYDPLLIECAIPQHQEIRFLAQLLDADARRASEQGDSSTFINDAVALVAMAEQNGHAAPFIVVDLVSSAIYRIALRLTAVVAAEHRELCSDEQLKQLVHAIAGFAGGGTLRWSLDGERQVFYDYLQRNFSDDGDGDGRLTAEGFESLNQWNYAANAQGRFALAWRTWGVELGLGGPIMSVEIAGRKEQAELANRLWDQVEVDYARPLWQWQESSAVKELWALQHSPLECTRYSPVLLLLWGTASHNVPLIAKQNMQQRDAVVAAIALELYHRRHNAWPATLAELTPSLLPSVPLDRFTGQPLQYRLVNGRPLLYSCGTDGDDDGGRPPKQGNRHASLWAPEAKLDADTISTEWAAAHDGDWILWPEPAQEKTN
ncbi:MAG TPA: hypothetical protein VHC19_23870 [Pirellulales bacterium]|nr:hypothetical protein [Pirellulales bacterium]